jgi:hypothetical protein
LRRLRQADREQRATERRIALLEEKAKQTDQARGIADDSKLTIEEKKRQARANLWSRRLMAKK